MGSNKKALARTSLGSAVRLKETILASTAFRPALNQFPKKKKEAIINIVIFFNNKIVY